MKTIPVAALFTFVLLPAVASAADDPFPSHTMPIEEAAKGVKGTGALMAKIEVQQGGKSLGTFSCELFEKQAPKTVANFVGLARGLRPFLDTKTNEWVKGKHFFDGLTFHRVIPDFMVQGGDPQGTGRGNPGYRFENEVDPTLKFDHPGVMAMANAGPNTNGSQFFITEAAKAYLNGNYSIFGQCEPIDLVAKIARVPKSSGDTPAEPVIMKSVTISRGGGGAKKK